MESPVIVSGIPSFVLNGNAKMENNGGFRGSPEPEDEAEPGPGGVAWEQLAARHPQLAELAGRVPAAWGAARKRRGSHDRPAAEFARESRSRERPFRDFFFDDLPPEFREHIPTRWNRHFEPEEEFEVPCSPPPPPQADPVAPTERPKFQTQTSTDKATQTVLPETPVVKEKNVNLPQYGLRNTVDLGQKTAAESGQSDGESARNQRSMSAPPESRFAPRPTAAAGNFPPQPPQPSEGVGNTKQPNVRHIPIFVEGRDEPVINMKKDTSANFAETRTTPPKEEFYQNHEIPQPFHPTPHFNRAFGSPFKGFGGRNVGAFTPNKAFTQPREQPQQQTFKQSASPPQAHPPQPAPEPDHQRHVPEQPQAPPEPPRPPPQQTYNNDPILKIQLIQKDVLDLMTQVENYTGKSKKEKEYMYLDEMLTRNLIKLDDIETEGKENIRLARKEAIKCIQKCINVLEAKAESNAERALAEENAKAEVAKMEQEPSTELTNGESHAASGDKVPADKEETPRGKSKEKSPSVQRMDVDKIEGQTEAPSAPSDTSAEQSAPEAPPTLAMEVEAPSH